MEECCRAKTTRRSAEDKKNITNRLNRILGQLNGIKNMVEEDRYCGDILIQLAAADKAVKALSAFVLEKHMHSCIVRSVQAGQAEVVDEVVELFKRFQ